MAPYEDTDVWRLFFGAPSFEAIPGVPVGGTGAAISSSVDSRQFTEEVDSLPTSMAISPMLLAYISMILTNLVDVSAPAPGFGASIVPFASLTEALRALPFFPVTSPDPLDPDNAAWFRFDRQKQYAAFGELTYSLSDTVNLIGGGRFYHYTYTQTIPYKVGAVVDSNTDSGKIKESGFNPKASIEWRPKNNGELLTYATVSKGFRLGGFVHAVPEACGASASGWKSDRVWNYELGSKIRLGNVAQINLAAYRTDWSKIPLPSSSPADSPRSRTPATRELMAGKPTSRWQ